MNWMSKTSSQLFNDICEIIEDKLLFENFFDGREHILFTNKDVNCQFTINASYPTIILDLQNNPTDSFIFKKNTANITNLGDFICFQKENNKIYMILIEMKSNCKKNTEIINQLKGSYCLGYYILLKAFLYRETSYINPNQLVKNLNRLFKIKFYYYSTNDVFKLPKEERNHIPINLKSIEGLIDFIYPNI
jgi:hypothetical protein